MMENNTGRLVVGRSLGVSAALLGAVAMVGSRVAQPLTGVTYGGHAAPRPPADPNRRKSRQWRTPPSNRGNLKRAARAALVERSRTDPKTIVVNRMTNFERTKWSGAGCPDVDWSGAEEHSRGRDYRVAA